MSNYCDLFFFLFFSFFLNLMHLLIVQRQPRICPLVLLFSPQTTPHKWHPRSLKRHPLPPLLSRLNLLSRDRNPPLTSGLVRSPPRTFASFLRENCMATRTHMPKPPGLTPSCYPFRLTPSPVRGSQTLLSALPSPFPFPYRSPPRFHCF